MFLTILSRLKYTDAIKEWTVSRELNFQATSTELFSEIYKVF